MVSQHFAGQLNGLVESIYETAFDSSGWGDVMGQMKTLFSTSAETFYLLNPATHRMREVHLAGIAPRWIDCFDEAYFSDDNPWMQLSDRLHQPGVVRTNERLIEYTREREVLYRSQYYNEWMRPQDFCYTIGNTLLREPGLIANVTLLRPHGMPTFSEQEVRAFERLSRHLTRALQFGLQFERVDRERTCALESLAHLPQAAFLVDPAAKVLHANPAAERLLRDRDGLLLIQGCLTTAAMQERQRFSRLLHEMLSMSPVAGAGTPQTLSLRRVNGARARAPLTVSVLPLSASRTGYRFAQRAALVLVAEVVPPPLPAMDFLRECFDLTPSEARLALRLADGDTLRVAANHLGIGYGTARGYLKTLFQKTATHRQTDLVRQVLARAAPH